MGKFPFLLWQHLLRELRRLEEARYTFKAWHSTLGSRPPQKKPLPCSYELTSDTNINLQSEDPAPIWSTSVAHYFWRMDCIRNKLEIHRTHHKLLRSLTSITKWPQCGEKQHGGGYVGKEVILPAYCQGLWQADSICNVKPDKEDSVCHTAIQLHPKA